ncbi:DegV family protein [Mycoplasmatota bacterium WC44]
MGKIGVVVCSNSGIDYINHPYDIDVIRSTLIYGEEEYLDYVDITANEFYKKIKDNPDVMPRTAQCPTGVIAETYEKYRDKGYDELLCITISSEMSGKYQGCVIASEMVEGIKVTVFDSKSVGYIESHMALEASRLIEEGKSIEEILPMLEYVRDNSKLVFAVPELKYLVKNGRLSNASGFIGSMMKIKPLLEVTKEGKVVSVEKIRTLRRAIERVVAKVLEETEDLDGEYVLIHADNPEQCDNIRTILKDSGIEGVNDYLLTPVVGCHSGPGAICLGFIPKYNG